MSTVQRPNMRDIRRRVAPGIRLLPAFRTCTMHVMHPRQETHKGKTLISAVRHVVATTTKHTLNSGT